MAATRHTSSNSSSRLVFVSLKSHHGVTARHSRNQTTRSRGRRAESVPVSVATAYAAAFFVHPVPPAEPGGRVGTVLSNGHSSRTGLVGPHPALRSAGVRHVCRSPAPVFIDTRSYLHCNVSCVEAMPMLRFQAVHRSKTEVSPRSAKYALRSPCSTATLWLSAHKA